MATVFKKMMKLSSLGLLESEELTTDVPAPTTLPNALEAPLKKDIPVPVSGAGVDALRPAGLDAPDNTFAFETQLREELYFGVLLFNPFIRYPLMRSCSITATAPAIKSLTADNWPDSMVFRRHALSTKVTSSITEEHTGCSG